MKKINLLIIILICLFIINVKADMGPPTVIEQEVMVTNKSGATCYENGKKTKKVIPYGTTLKVYEDINGSYIYVTDEKKYNCDVKYSDVSSKTQNFSLDNEEVEKMTPTRGIILAKGGLNMRKGPSVTYSKIMTIPQNALVTITHRAGSYWYYAEYGDKSGWITGMDGYFGYDSKEVVISPEPMKIYSTYDKKAVLGKIPANTEITDYINLVNRADSDVAHYVSYNGTKGYVEQMMYKTDGVGKIKLLKDYEVHDMDGKLVRKITPQELEYTMIDEFNNIYVSDKKIALSLEDDEFEFIKKVNKLTKTKGYLGEGIFGEEKVDKLKAEETKEETSEPVKKIDNNPNSTDTKDIIIICLLAGIFIALTALVIIKLVNSKKNKKVKIFNQPVEEESTEIDKPEE